MLVVETRATNLGHDGGDVHAAVILPAVHAGFLWHVRQVHIDAWLQASPREPYYVLQPVSGASAGLQSAALAVSLRRDAAVPPRGAEVDARGDEAAVRRRVGEEHDGEAGEAVGDDGHAEQEEDLLLEAAPLPEEGGGSLVVAHVACGSLSRTLRIGRAEMWRR